MNMPQITVTIDDASYLELIHHLPKGMKSRFVNAAVHRAIDDCCWYVDRVNMGVVPVAMNQYARTWGRDIDEWIFNELERMKERSKMLPNEINWYSRGEAATHPNQTKLQVGEEE